MPETVDCDLEDLGEIIVTMLDDFNQEVCDGMKREAKKAAEDLKKEAAESAPKDTGEYARAISAKKLTENPFSVTYAWYVKKPHYRLTHLLIYGHAMKSGGRTKAQPFLQRAYVKVKKEYEKGCEKVIDNAAR